MTPAMNSSSSSWTHGSVIDLGGSWTLATAPAIAGRAGQGATPVVTAESTQPLGVTGAPGAPTAPPSPFGGGLLFAMLGMLVLMIFMSTWSARKEKKKRAELMDSLARYDRVQTIGGVIGTIVELKDSEIVLKVDENTNTKITFAKSAVQGVLKKGPGGAATSAEATLPAGAKA